MTDTDSHTRPHSAETCTDIVLFDESSPVSASYRRSCAERTFQFCGRELTFAQDLGDDVHQPKAPGELGFGGIVRDAALALARYIEAHPGTVAGKNVLELGAGMGLVSTACSLLGAARVVATDGDAAVVEACQRNIVRNLGVAAGGADKGGDGGGGGGGARVLARVLRWGDEGAEEAVAPPFDVILAADIVCCVYEGAYVALAGTLQRLCGKHAAVLLSYKRRHGSEERFFELIEPRFRLERVPCDDLHSDFQQPGCDITLFRLTPRISGSQT